MNDTDSWLDEFARRHDSASSPTVFWISLLFLLIGVAGLLWSLPIPAEFSKISPLLNWGSAFLMASLVYYFIISVPLGIGMVPFIWGISVLHYWLSGQAVPLGPASSVLIGTSVAGLTLGHYGAGGLRAVLGDVQLVMIAPVWLLSNIYRRLGIPF
jgi:hypothetical protein